MSASHSAGPKATIAASVVVAASGAFWGLWWIPLRFLERHGLSGNWASVALNAVAALITMPVMLSRPWPSRQDFRRIMVVGLLVGFTFASWNHALLYGAVVRVTLLFYLSPIWASLLGILLLGDAIGPGRVFSIVLGLSGASLVLQFRGFLPLPHGSAEWLALISGITFAFATVYVRKTHDVGALEKTLANCIFAVPSALIFLVFAPAPPPALGTLVGALPLILLSCVWLVPVAFLLLWGAARLDPGRVAILLLFEVLASAISAALFAGEPFGWREGAGCFLIVSAGIVEGISQLRTG